MQLQNIQSCNPENPVIHCKLYPEPRKNMKFSYKYHSDTSEDKNKNNKYDDVTMKKPTQVKSNKCNTSYSTSQSFEKNVCKNA